MTTSLDTFIVPVRYYSALDPYNWKVDNRPLSDLEDNDDVLRSGIETNLNIGKLQAAIMGALHQNVFGRGKAVGHAYNSTGLTWRIERSLMNGWITDDGKEVATLALQVDPQVFLFTAPSAGNKTLTTIYATYDLPNPTDLPYFDDTQFLDAGALSFPSLACKVGSVIYTTNSSTVVVSDPDTYPSTPSGSIPLFHIKVLNGDTALTDVTYVHFVEEGAAIEQPALGFLTLVRAKAHAIDEVLTNLSIPTYTDVDSITQVGVHYLNNDTGITNLPRLAGFGSSLRVTEATTVTATSGIIYQEVTSPGDPWYKAFRSGMKQHVVGTFNDYAFHWTDWIYAVNPAHSVGFVGNTAGPSNYLTNVQVEDFILNSFINVDTSLVVTSGHTFYEVNFYVNTLQDAPDGSVVHIRLAPPASPGSLTPVRITSNLMSPSNTIEITDVNRTVSVMKYSIFGSAAFIFIGQGNII